MVDNYYSCTVTDLRNNNTVESVKKIVARFHSGKLRCTFRRHHQLAPIIEAVAFVQVTTVQILRTSDQEVTKLRVRSQRYLAHCKKAHRAACIPERIRYNRDCPLCSHRRCKHRCRYAMQLSQLPSRVEEVQTSSTL